MCCWCIFLCKMLDHITLLRTIKKKKKKKKKKTFSYRPTLPQEGHLWTSKLYFFSWPYLKIINSFLKNKINIKACKILFWPITQEQLIQLKFNCQFWVSQTICFRMLTLFFKKVFIILKLKCLFLVWDAILLSFDIFITPYINCCTDNKEYIFANPFNRNQINLNKIRASFGCGGLWKQIWVCTFNKYDRNWC